MLGFHFRHSDRDGTKLGRQVARYILAQRFKRPGIALMGRLEKELRAEESRRQCADRSTDEEAPHAGVITVTAITFDVSAEKSARKNRRLLASRRQRCVFWTVCDRLMGWSGIPAERGPNGLAARSQTFHP